ncbi:DUF6705 family protein [Larkinella sp. GY13]|uniref:DUF6705 family protein n=1 Tax=Larkinella sp. GY13 TaxID=3453720 RepID=UPI003EE91096
MKYLLVFFVLSLVACSKESPQPQLSADTQAERAATIDSFVGEWIYRVDESPFLKIVIEKKTNSYSFKHYKLLAGSYVLDNDEYYVQDLVSSAFVSWEKSSVNHPYISIKSFYSSSGSWLHYRMISGKQYLTLGGSKYQKSL